MGKIGQIFAAGCFSLALLGAGRAEARDYVQIAGSSTVLPYARLAADAFAESYPQYKTPVIESGGSGAGIKEFCRSVAEDSIDIANSSRAIKPAELAACANAGVTEVEELRIGYDGVVLATGKSGKSWNLTPKDIYTALAAQIFIDGKLRVNPHKNWHEVNADLPEWEIAAYIPGEKHGTREVFEEKLLLQGCRDSGAYQAFKAMSFADDAARDACIAVRKDGRTADIDGDYSETLARLNSNPQGLGVFGLSFYQNNADKLQLATVSGIVPSEQTIADGQYAVSRPLFMYVKKMHLGVIPGMREYVDFFLSDQMIGSGGPLADYGLIPEPEKERRAQRAAFAAGEAMPLPPQTEAAEGAQ